MRQAEHTNPGETISLSRRYRGVAVSAVWDAWTTAEGFSAWWGPSGFGVTVSSSDFRAGGGLRYVMTAIAPDQVRFMERAGLPRATSVAVRIGEFLHGHRLTLVQSASFIPDVEPYDVTTTVEFGSTSGAVPGARIRVNLETMHDEDWTDRAVAGWRGQLRRLSRYLQSTRA